MWNIILRVMKKQHANMFMENYLVNTKNGILLSNLKKNLLMWTDVQHADKNGILLEHKNNKIIFVY